jgi:tetratricopeptide (TPR) repeat protein
MPEAGRVLQFRPRQGRPAVPTTDSARLARAYIATPPDGRSEEAVAETLANPDCVLAICANLKGRCDVEPMAVYEEAARLYRWVETNEGSLVLFDERDYFLGESALVAGNAARQLGKRDEAECWLDRAEASFRHTVNPAPLLANAAYARLALHYDRRQYQRVFELLPSLRASYRKLGMTRELLKCDFLAAMALKESSKVEEALDKLQEIAADRALANEPDLEALVLLHFGELLSSTGRYAEAVSCLREVSKRETSRTQPLVAAHLKSAMAEAFRQQGMLAEAVEALQGAAEAYASAGMATLEAYLRIILAETLIAVSRTREAEWQIAAALPIIEEQKMVPEGLAALSLLRESVRRRQTDSKALREVRERLQSIR